MPLNIMLVRNSELETKTTTPERVRRDIKWNSQRFLFKEFRLANQGKDLEGEVLNVKKSRQMDLVQISFFGTCQLCDAGWVTWCFRGLVSSLIHWRKHCRKNGAYENSVRPRL